MFALCIVHAPRSRDVHLLVIVTDFVPAALLPPPLLTIMQLHHNACSTIHTPQLAIIAHNANAAIACAGARQDAADDLATGCSILHKP